MGGLTQREGVEDDAGEGRAHEEAEDAVGTEGAEIRRGGPRHRQLQVGPDQGALAAQPEPGHGHRVRIPLGGWSREGERKLPWPLPPKSRSSITALGPRPWRWRLVRQGEEWCGRQLKVKACIPSLTPSLQEYFCPHQAPRRAGLGEGRDSAKAPGQVHWLVEGAPE